MQIGIIRIERLRPALGTLVALSVDAPSKDIGLTALEAAWDAVQRVDTLMHPTRGGSDLAALRATPVGEALAVHAWTYDVLQLARGLHRDSGGVFDPCLPDVPGTFGNLELLEGAQLRRGAELHLDLGGIAKGFAVDRAVDALRNGGGVAGLVNAGGDLRVFGARAETVQLGCRGPGCLRLENAALAVSQPVAGAPPEHRGYYCRVAGYARINSGAAIVAPTAAVADALTKCALFLPPDPLAALCARHAAQLLTMS